MEDLFINAQYNIKDTDTILHKNIKMLINVINPNINPPSDDKILPITRNVVEHTLNGLNNLWFGTQNDAHEFLVQLLDRIEVVNSNDKQVFIIDGLRGLFKETIQPLENKKCLDVISYNYTTFTDISIQIHGNCDITQAISWFETQEHIEDSNNLYKIDSTTSIPFCRTIQIFQTPLYVIVHFKRFKSYYQKDSSGRYILNKKGHPIEASASDTGQRYKFVTEKLTHETTVPEAITIGGVEYETRSIVVHRGVPNSGHYVAYGKRGDQWYFFDDHSVTHKPGMSPDTVKDAYIVLLRRVNPVQHGSSRYEDLYINLKRKYKSVRQL